MSRPSRGTSSTRSLQPLHTITYRDVRYVRYIRYILDKVARARKPKLEDLLGTPSVAERKPRPSLTTNISRLLRLSHSRPSDQHSVHSASELPSALSFQSVSAARGSHFAAGAIDAGGRALSFPAATAGGAGGACRDHAGGAAAACHPPAGGLAVLRASSLDSGVTPSSARGVAPLAPLDLAPTGSDPRHDVPPGPPTSTPSSSSLHSLDLTPRAPSRGSQGSRGSHVSLLGRLPRAFSAMTSGRSSPSAGGRGSTAETTRAEHRPSAVSGAL